jgi:alcohol dehydrogenase (cytochrome c)
VKVTWATGWDKAGRPIVDHATDSAPEGTIVWPTGAATNFQAPSYDRESAILFQHYNDSQGFMSMGPAVFERGKLYTARGTVIPPPGPSPKSGIEALDTTTGEAKWKFPVMRATNAAGVIATRGGLVFAATAEGQFIALDANSGEALWNFRTGGPISASPISYAVDGKQYIVDSAGNALFVFGLP